MKYIKNADQGAKFWSNWAAGGAAILAIQEALPIWEAIIPEGAFAILAAIVATAGIYLRMVDQGLEK
jgi:hypothetical protein